jgi:hypothetical protein
MRQQYLDSIRRWGNLVLAVAQIAVTGLAFGLGTDFNQQVGQTVPDPPIVPAGYAFIVWSAIYAGCLAYGIYQFLPSRRTDSLLRRMGWFTMSAFAGCCCWLLCARFQHVPWTVPCIYWMAISLYGAFRPLWSLQRPSPGLRWCVLPGISMYSGWVSVAIFANTASVAKAYHWPPALLGTTDGSIMLIVAAALLAGILFRRSGDNFWYAGTIAWAVIGIGVRSQFELRNEAAALAAWIVLATAALLLFREIALRGKLEHLNDLQRIR